MSTIPFDTGIIARRLGRRAVKSRLHNTVRRAFAALRECRRRRLERAALANFDDRMLRDIGLTRVDALFEINKPFWRK